MNPARARNKPETQSRRGVPLTLEQLVRSLQDQLEDDELVVAVVADLMWRGRLRRTAGQPQERQSAAA